MPTPQNHRSGSFAQLYTPFDGSKGRVVIRTPDTNGVDHTGYEGDYVVPDGHVGIVQNIQVNGVDSGTGASADTRTTSFRIGGSDVLSFKSHIDATTLARPHKHQWCPQGAVIPAGSTIEATTSRAFGAISEVSAPAMSLSIITNQEAEQLKLRNAALVGGTASATPSTIIPAVAGQCVEILAIYGSYGNSATAASERKLRLEYDDGSTQYPIYELRSRNVLAEQSGNASISRIDKCFICGPAGFGVRIVGTDATMQNAAYINVAYRYIAENQADYWDLTGQPNNPSTVRGGRRFWFFDESNGHTAGSVNGVPLFPNGLTTRHGGILDGFAGSGCGGSGVTLGWRGIAGFDRSAPAGAAWLHGPIVEPANYTVNVAEDNLLSPFGNVSPAEVGFNIQGGGVTFSQFGSMVCWGRVGVRGLTDGFVGRTYANFAP